TAVNATGVGVLTGRGVTRTERFEPLRRPRHAVDDPDIALTPGPGARDVPGGEDRQCHDLHESSLAPSRRRRIEEMPALAAVSPASPPATTPAFAAVSLDTASFRRPAESTPGSRALMPRCGPSASMTLSSSRCTWFLRLKSLIGIGAPFSGDATPSRWRRRARLWSCWSGPRC